MKIVEFALSMLLTVSAVALGFGCSLAIASAWLHSIVRALTRNTYNVSSVPDSCAAGVRDRVVPDLH